MWKVRVFFLEQRLVFLFVEQGWWLPFVARAYINFTLKAEEGVGPFGELEPSEK